ncbi:hypothetical protein K6V72_22440 [Ralstonia insidiosa]|nr:hypothetical protein [Ralstonia insidiosa]KAB0473150.1 hypothetical protein F7R11_11555 [Ralstonia insidiosa]MBY4911773.1 hypothetical protein [Ralstonia insidiosa]
MHWDIVADGSANALVNNSGSLRTENGSIALVATVRDAVARSVLNNTGTIEARSLTHDEYGIPRYGHVELITSVLSPENTHQTRMTVNGVVDAEGGISVIGGKTSIGGDLSAPEIWVFGDATTTDRALMRTSYLQLLNDNNGGNLGNFDFRRGSIFVNQLVTANTGKVDISLSGTYGDSASLLSLYTMGDVRIHSADDLYVWRNEVQGELNLSSQGTIWNR